MATATSPKVTLTLDTEEAGYLIDLLAAHVGGSLLDASEPLGRIRQALRAAGVERRHAVARPNGQSYAAIYRR